MPLQTTALLIKGDLSDNYADLFKKLGLKGGEPGAMVPFDYAVSNFDNVVAAAALDGWTVLWGNLPLYVVDEKALTKLAKKADVFQMTLEGSSGTAGFTWWTGGKLVRKWLRQGGKVVINDGKPLAEEKKAFASAKGDEEDAVQNMLTRLTLPLKKLAAIQYQVYEFPEEELFGGE